MSNASLLPTGQLWRCNSFADGRFRRCGDQTNADVCFLLLLLAPLSKSETSHIFTHALLLQSPPIIFSRLSPQSQGVGEKSCGGRHSGNKRTCTCFPLRKKILLAPPLLPPFWNTTPRNIFRPFASAAAAASAYVTGEHPSRCRASFPSASVLKRSIASQQQRNEPVHLFTSKL